MQEIADLGDMVEVREQHMQNGIVDNSAVPKTMVLVLETPVVLSTQSQRRLPLHADKQLVDGYDPLDPP